MSIRTKHIASTICIAIGVAALGLEAVLAATRHYGDAQTIAGCIFPLMAVVGGLTYLRSTRGRS